MLKYDKRITLQSNSPIEFRGGCYTESWATVTTIWANISSVASETDINIKLQQYTDLQIVVRHTTSISKVSCRFLYDGQVVRIVDINDKTLNGNQLIIRGRIENAT
jgi:SPP1 family predicted phage head-tail adaptor